MWKAVTSSSLALMVAAPIAVAGPDAGDRSFLLSGTGASDDSFDSNSFGVSGQIGWFTRYQFLFSNADEIDDQFDDGALFYTLGVGYNF